MAVAEAAVEPWEGTSSSKAMRHSATWKSPSIKTMKLFAVFDGSEY